jgi:hypothetical protein
MKHIKMPVELELLFGVMFPDACDYDFARFVLGSELSDATEAERERRYQLAAEHRLGVRIWLSRGTAE